MKLNKLSESIDFDKLRNFKAKYFGDDDCISVAQSVIDLYGKGEIYGLALDFKPYDEDGEPKLRYKGQENGEAIDSHYWAVVDGHLIDPWIGYEYDLRTEDLSLVVQQYGPPGSWRKLTDEEKEEHFKGRDNPYELHESKAHFR